MPIYDYVCSQCGHRIEVMHGIHAEGPRTCEVCGGALKKALSPPAIVFRGTGWAKKERASASRKAAAASSGSSKGTSEAGSSASSTNDGSGAKATSGGESTPAAAADKTSTSPTSSKSSAPSGT